ncbi:MAG: hypothetical protein HGJ94_20460 [Desulfosarcina sp.]|nr:hypothetical protein [Desulfosarcina sp.]MBC2742226.1 hypothetical protein [Desulfosarcina sp.]MBC2765138.1 hypothetical protein [Desulfosarcina sp.]
MKEIKDNKETKFNFKQAGHRENQREKDRREELCEGFTYISTVGWICRREKTRRKDLESPQ